MTNTKQSVSYQNLDILTMKIQCTKMHVVTDKHNVHEMSMRVELSDTQYYYCGTFVENSPCS